VYLNIQSLQFPGGEIRGQLVVSSAVAEPTAASLVAATLADRWIVRQEHMEVVTDEERRIIADYGRERFAALKDTPWPATLGVLEEPSG
jgi:hypothetical protein